MDEALSKGTCAASMSAGSQIDKICMLPEDLEEALPLSTLTDELVLSCVLGSLKRRSGKLHRIE